MSIKCLGRGLFTKARISDPGGSNCVRTTRVTYSSRCRVWNTSLYAALSYKWQQWRIRAQMVEIEQVHQIPNSRAIGWLIGIAIVHFRVG